jgi:cytochrome c553
MTRRLVRAAISTCALLVWFVLPSTAHADARRSRAPDLQKQGYVGAEVCVTCHEGYDASVNRSKHAFAKDPRTPAAKEGCESCHGPGEAHTQDPANVKFLPKSFAKITPNAEDRRAVQCQLERRDRHLYVSAAGKHGAAATVAIGAGSE